MTDMSKYNSDYPVDSMIKSKVTSFDISGGGTIYISIDRESSFGHGLMYIDERGNEQMIFMTYDAYHQLVGEMVRWM